MKNLIQNTKTNFLASIAFLSLIGGTFTSCNKSETVTPVIQKIVGKPITSTSLSGGISNGTLTTAVGAYTVTGDITILPNDTFYVQKGVTVTVNNNAIIKVQGTLIIEGTQDNPSTFTTTDKKQGGWGGFATDSAKYVSIKWTHIEYTGGPDATASPRKSITMSKPDSIIVQDCWIIGGSDDGIRLEGGAKFKILRNTIEGQGTTDGEAINIKTGANGIVAYNVVSRGAGTGIKLETSSTILNPQTEVYVYNNTVIGQGFRRGAAEPGRGISVDKNAIGHIFNNVLINNYYGLDIQTAADVAHTTYGNNYFYNNLVVPPATDTLRQFFYPLSSKGVKKASDIVVADRADGNPMKFTSFDPSIIEYTADFKLVSNNTNPKPLAGSPLIGSGYTTYNADMGAYTSDGQGNKH